MSSLQMSNEFINLFNAHIYFYVVSCFHYIYIKQVYEFIISSLLVAFHNIQHSMESTVLGLHNVCEACLPCPFAYVKPGAQQKPGKASVSHYLLVIYPLLLLQLLFPQHTSVNFIIPSWFHRYCLLLSACSGHLFFFWSAIFDRLLDVGLILSDPWVVTVYSRQILAGSVNILSNDSAHSHTDYVN